MKKRNPLKSPSDWQRYERENGIDPTIPDTWVGHEPYIKRKQKLAGINVKQPKKKSA